jgi:hypothetical protein
MEICEQKKYLWLIKGNGDQCVYLDQSLLKFWEGFFLRFEVRTEQTEITETSVGALFTQLENKRIFSQMAQKCAEKICKTNHQWHQ